MFTLIKELLMANSDREIQYSVPAFQREYTWRRSEWEQLWDDLTATEKVGNSWDGYYLGTIITMPASDSGGYHNAVFGCSKFELIDGQQRLTTISLLLLAIYNHITGKPEFLSIVKDPKYLNRGEFYRYLFRAIVNYDTTVIDYSSDAGEQLNVKNFKLKLQEGANGNQEDYAALLYEILSKNPNVQLDKPSRKIDQRKRIYAAFHYFENRLNELTTFDEISDLCGKVFAAKVVNIPVEDSDHAFEIFDSVNNRGVPLSASDLIKNSLLRIASERRIQPQCLKQWKKIIENLGDEPKIHERFLRHYYCLYKESYRQADNGNDLLKKAPKSKLISIYSKWIKDYPLELITDIANASEIYKYLIHDSLIKDIDSSDTLYECKNEIRQFIHVKGSVGNILLLYITKEKDELSLSNNDIKQIITNVSKFFLWRNLTGKPASNELDDLFIRIVEGIKGGSNTKIAEYVQSELAKSLLPQKELKEVLNGNLYLENEDMTRFILCTLLEMHQSSDDKTDYWEKESKAAKAKYTFSIEHILPEGIPLPDEWVQEIAKGDSRLAASLQEEYCHKIGNLTLTIIPNNSALSNKPFLEKRNLVDKKDKNKAIGYKNGKWLNGDLGLVPDEKWTQSQIDGITVSQTDTWTIQQIKDRTEALVEIVYKMFSLNTSE